MLTQKQQDAVDALELHGTKYAAARALDISVSSLRDRLKWAYNSGSHLSPGARDSAAKAQLGGMEVRGGHRRVYDEDGKQIDTVRYSVPVIEDDPADLAQRIAETFASIPAAPPIVKSEKTPDGKIALFAQTDVHLGAKISADHGGTEYSPDIAMDRMRDGFAKHHASMPPRETTIILDNGDLTHSNDDRDVTFRSEHRLKVDGSYQRNLLLCIAAKSWQIDMALRTSDRVIYRGNKGNHDPSTPAGMIGALLQRYRDNPRVTIDQSERKTWVYQQGQLFLSAHHGDGIKPEKFAAHLPSNFPQEFGASRHWYFMTGHYHEAKQASFGGINWFQLPSICAMDQNSSDMGYSDGSAMRSFLFCESGGLRDDFTTRF